MSPVAALGTESVVGTVSGIVPLTNAELTDLFHPVGSVVTVNSVYAGPLSGATMPERGATGGSFLAFDDAATESAVFMVGSFIPRTWRTVDLYIEVVNISGSGGNVRWRTNVSSGGDTDETQTWDASVLPAVQKIGGQTYTLGSKAVAGVDRYGATVAVSRIGGDVADTFAADFNLAALHAVRIT